MTFESPEIEKLRKAYAQSGNAIAMTARLETSTGVVELDLVRILLELAARDDSNLHFMDPPLHHTGTPKPRVTVPAEDNPTGRVGIGGD